MNEFGDKLYLRNLDKEHVSFVGVKSSIGCAYYTLIEGLNPSAVKAEKFEMFLVKAPKSKRFGY